MAKCDKLLKKAREAPNNIRFDELCQLAECYGFQFQRQNSSHCTYKHPEYPDLLTFQKCSGTVKPAYVRDLLNAIEELGGPYDE
jgi:predicted RNA binding protein YcfA (HicA-like mRNA interferase family)